MSFMFSTQLNTTSRQEKVCDWAGTKKKTDTTSSSTDTATTALSPDAWKDVSSNIKKMDSNYDATFHAWLKSEDNVLVTSLYLHRIANDYPLERIINALEWLSADWRWESTSILVRHVTADWVDEEGDRKRAKLLRKLTRQWATHFTATMITTILISAPYTTCNKKRESFIQEFTRDWDFSKLSEFFMFLRSRANIDYKFKCAMLQEAARKEAEEQPHQTTSTIKSARQHQRRVSFSDEMKKPYLENTMAGNSSGANDGASSSAPASSSTASASSSSSTTTANLQSRYNNDSDQLANLLVRK
ncbi:uncharacterized protein ATC70_005421 [Mucor velutinosus]|uniref:Uncharacterized protein n=1 Tax=Mucor velutinosus TaxID=708070 RepID=A0AAN7D9G8_9FUNG|nr:hypothetical protein ATC70_005421 [Mucor velutinosus]